VIHSYNEFYLALKRNEQSNQERHGGNFKWNFYMEEFNLKRLNTIPFQLCDISYNAKALVRTEFSLGIQVQA
jgi:hypothetical protein